MRKALHLGVREWVVLLTVCWMAFAVRVNQLDEQSLWVDEGLLLARVQQGLPAILSGQVAIDGGQVSDPSSPLYPLLLAVVRAAGGEYLLSLRLTSVWLGVIGVASLWVLGRRLFGRQAGMAAALLGAFSPYWVWYNQVTHSDSLLLTTSLLSILALHGLLVRPGRGQSGWQPWWRGGLWFVATAAMLYSHPTGLFVFAFELLVLAIWVARRKIGAPALVWTAAGLAIAVPMILEPNNGPTILEAYRAPWHEARHLFFAATADGGALGAGLRSLPTALLLLASVAWLVSYPRRVGSLVLALGYLVMPALIALWLTDLSGSDMTPQYVVIGVPAMYLLQGAGVATLWRRWRPLALATLMAAIAVMGYWLHFQATNPGFVKDDLRPAAAYVSQYATADDVVILNDALIQPAWNYYYDGPAAVEVIPHCAGESREEMLARFLAVGEAHRRIWFLRQPASPGCRYPGLLLQQAETHWIKLEEQSFSSPWLSVELSQYAPKPPLVDRLPADATPAGICWPTGLCLHGWSAGNLVPGNEAEVTLYWSQVTPTDEDYSVWLTIRDGKDQPWTDYQGPIFRFYPAARWPMSQLLQQTILVPLSPAFPPTTFSLTVAVHWRASEQPLVSAVGRYHNPLGQVTLTRPAAGRDVRALSLQVKNDADFDVVRLLGYNLPNDRPRPGHITFVDFYWQALDKPVEDWWQRTRLIDKAGQVWVQETAPLGMTGFTVAQWEKDDLIWERVFLPLPGQMPPGEYELEVSLLDTDGEFVPASEIWRVEKSHRVIAGPAYVASWPLITEPPPMPHRPDAILGGTIRLWGYQIQSTGGKVRPGEELLVTLVWRDELPMEGDYRVFLHLMDQDGKLLAQDDGVPANWTRPTTTWRAGEYVVDERMIRIPPDTPAGPVFFWTGLYDPDGAGRLTVTGAAEGQPDDRVLLDVLIVEP